MTSGLFRSRSSHLWSDVKKSIDRTENTWIEQKILQGLWLVQAPRPNTSRAEKKRAKIIFFLENTQIELKTRRQKRKHVNGKKSSTKFFSRVYDKKHPYFAILKQSKVCQLLCDQIYFFKAPQAKVTCLSEQLQDMNYLGYS